MSNVNIKRKPLFSITACTKVFELLLHLQPIFRKFKLLAKEEEKCPESAFKLLFYSIAYGYCFYLLFSGKYDFFHETKNCWRGKCCNTRVSQFWQVTITLSPLVITGELDLKYQSELILHHRDRMWQITWCSLSPENTKTQVKFF